MKILEEIQEPRLQESVLLAESAGGTRIALARTPGYSTRAAFFGLRFGSNHVHFRNPEGQEVHVPWGSAHFLEHKLFEGREEKVFDRFGRLGANFNGGTSFARTSYYFVTSQHFHAATEVLLDFVQDPLITEERVEKEKGLIEPDVRMYEDDPNYRGYFLLLRALYHKHAIRISPGGPVDEVHRTTAADLQACYDAYYRPHNLCLSLAGDFNPEEILAALEPQLQGPRPGAAEAIFEQEPALPAHERLEEEFAVSRPHVWLGWRDPSGPGAGMAQLRHRILSSLVLDLVFEHSSPWYEELYQQGIVDDSFGAQFSCDEDWSYASVEMVTEHPDRFLDGVRETVARFAEAGPDPQAVERIRRAAWGGAVSSSQTPASLASAHLASLLQGTRPFAVLDVLDSIQLDEVAQRAREMFQPERSAAALLVPRSS